MAYDVSALTNYTREYEGKLVIKSMFDGKTAQVVSSLGNLQTGIKTSEKINILDNGVHFAADSCGFSSSGSTTFTQRAITVGSIKVNQSFCVQDLEDKWTQKELPIGNNYTKIPFEQYISELYAGQIAQKLEAALWKGNTSSGNFDYKHFDGLIKLIDAASGVTQGNTTSITTATGITASNAHTIFQNMYAAAPAAILGKSDLRFFCGWDVFRLLKLNLTNLNLFQYNGEDTNGELTLPGTDVKVIAVHGLNTNVADGVTANDYRIFLMRVSNIFLGTDMQNEEEKYEIFFAKEADEMRFVARFKMGIQVAFPNEIVKFTLV